MKPTRQLGSYGAYLFDADGTLTYLHHPIPGAPSALGALKAAGKRVLVVTNNSRLSRAGVTAKLQELGFPIEEADVFTAVMATAQLVARDHPGGRVLVVGSDGLRRELEEHGVMVVDRGPADCVVVGTDLELTYQKLVEPVRALLDGTRFIAVNVDQLIPDPGGFLPGSAFVVGGLQAATGHPPDVVVGKPSTILLEEARAQVGLPAEECLFVGDSFLSDISAAHAVGMPTLLVLTGVTSPSELETAAIRPDHILDSVADLVSFLPPLAGE